MSFEIKQTKTLSDKHVAYVLCTAMEGGIGYWAAVVGYIKPKEMPERSIMGDEKLYRHIDYPMAGGAVLLIEDDDYVTLDEESGRYVDIDGKPVTVHRLDRAAIERGLNLMANKYPDSYKEILDEEYDVWPADMMVQLGLFGEVVYG